MIKIRANIVFYVLISLFILVSLLYVNNNIKYYGLRTEYLLACKENRRLEDQIKRFQEIIFLCSNIVNIQKNQFEIYELLTIRNSLRNSNEELFGNVKVKLTKDKRKNNNFGLGGY